MLTVSPFYHFNRAHYVGGYSGVPDPEVVIPQDDRGSNYRGRSRLPVTYRRGRHNAQRGVQVYGQHDNQFFGVVTSDGSNDPSRSARPCGEYDKQCSCRISSSSTQWLTLNGGVRLTHFGGGSPAGSDLPRVVDNAADPRIGAALQIPKLHWVARAFWGRYYQAPPLLTVSGPLIEECTVFGLPVRRPARRARRAARVRPDDSASLAGRSMSATSARARKTSSITTCSETPTSFSR